MSHADTSGLTSAGAAEADALPLFPLNTVLFPGGALPLRIFETRYVDMVRRCMRDASPFGVVLIRSGAEVGPIVDIADLGTTARIVDFNAMPDGLLGITCTGDRKFRVIKRWQQSDGLNLANFEYLPCEGSNELPGEYRHLGELLRKILPELGDLYANMTGDFSDASWVSCRLAEILPLSLSDRLGLLALDDPLVRLAKLSPLVRRIAD
ncbi:MAG: peptidase lon protein [Gammaproteobacteria bacterium]|nr:peptidase lon protein [Gammaproteobacteria bacterium]